MNTENSKKIEFNEEHPWPDKAGIASLYRFIKIDWSKEDRLEDLFINVKLYQVLPKGLNDPFECKPHFVWPNDAAKVKSMRAHLVKSAKKIGVSKKHAEKQVSKLMSDSKNTREIIFKVMRDAYAKLRLCSFTETKDNLLFWSHYADSHRGICIEFDATSLLISYAYKVKYSDSYPAVDYPISDVSQAFRPALIKSKYWEYESEYRTIFNPDSATQPENDGESFILKGNEIKNIYFGANMKNDDKNRLIKLINKGPFNPKFWNARLSKSAFSLEFEEWS